MEEKIEKDHIEKQLENWERRMEEAAAHGAEKEEEEERRRVADLQSSYLRRTGRTEMKP